MAPNRIEVSIDVPPQRLWWACSTIEGLSAWQADEIEGEIAPGSTLEFCWPGLGLSADVTVEKLGPSQCITLATRSWRLTLEVCEPGLVLTLDGPNTEDEVEGALSGWKLSVALLRHQLIHHWGATRNSDWLVRPVEASAPQLHAFFSDPVALRTWLGTTETPLGAEGSRAELQLRWGETLRGTVLSHTVERDLALSWEEQGNSVLSLRTLPSPRAETERLVLLQWSRWQSTNGDTHATLNNLEASLNRLGQLFTGSGSA